MKTHGVFSENRGAKNNILTHVIMLSLAVFSFFDRRVNLEKFGEIFIYLIIRHLQRNFQKFQ